MARSTTRTRRRMPRRARASRRARWCFSDRRRQSRVLGRSCRRVGPALRRSCGSCETSRSMPLEMTQLHPLFAAEISGLDLARPLPEDAIAQIRTVIDRDAVLVFRNQHLDDETQLAFARHFGPIEPPQAYRSEEHTSDLQSPSF